jgi:8-oxo-dGTP pyrophosphatase MutT (NUDIX family)
VLVPIVARPGGPTLVFTRRPDDMPTHGGQIALPGGRRENPDRDLAATALREAAEEVGLAPASVDVLGELDDVATPFGFVITPVVGWIAEPPALVHDPREVVELFELSPEALGRPGVHRDSGSRELAGRSYRLHEFHVEDRLIWGATARVVRQLLDVLG